MKSNLQKERFANCCGMDTIWNWPYARDESFSNVISDLEDIQVMCPMSNYIAILTGAQHSCMEEHLPKYGWRLVGSFYNYVHDNLLYLWVFESNPDRAPSNPLFRKDLFGIDDSKRHLRPHPGVKPEDIPHVHTVWIIPDELRKVQPPSTLVTERERGYNRIAREELRFRRQKFD